MSGYNLKKKKFLSEDLSYLYSVDPDEMQHNNAELCCISSGSSLFAKVLDLGGGGGFQNIKGI